MSKTLITSSRTAGQEENYRRLVEDAAKRAAKLALKKIKADKAGWQQVLKCGNGLRKAIAETVVSKTRELFVSNQLIADWQLFYRNVFGIETDFSQLVIPSKQLGFDRLLIVAQGMTPHRLYDKCAELFPSWKWTEQNLDEIVISDRTAKDGPYAIWVRNEIEADEKLKNLSANDLARKNIPCITLEERFLYELKYFRETGKHLDIQNVTLCSGLRDSGGVVPRVGWFGGGLCVFWYGSDFAGGCLRSRQKFPKEVRYRGFSFPARWQSAD